MVKDLPLTSLSPLHVVLNKTHKTVLSIFSTNSFEVEIDLKIIVAT